MSSQPARWVSRVAVSALAFFGVVACSSDGGDSSATSETTPVTTGAPSPSTDAGDVQPVDCDPVVPDPVVMTRIDAIGDVFADQHPESSEERALSRELNDLLAQTVVGTCEDDFNELCAERSYECRVFARDGVIEQEPHDEFDWRELYVTVDNGTITSVGASVAVDLTDVLILPSP